MANPVTPVPPSCSGTFADGTADIQLKCLKSSVGGNDVYTCAGMKYFKVNCPVSSQQCNTTSGAYVAAVTVCNQKLF